MDNHVTRSINENTATKPILIIVLVLSDCLGVLAIRMSFFYYPFFATSTATNRTVTIRGLVPGARHPPARQRSDVSSLLFMSIFLEFRIHTDKIWPFDGPIGFFLVNLFMFVQKVIGAISDALITFWY